MTDYSDQYHEILRDLVSPGRAVHDYNERTKQRTRVLRGGRSIFIDLSGQGQVPVPGNRRVYPRTAAAETAWYFMGTENGQWIRANCQIWDKFIEDDGRTITGSYGYRWRNHFELDQVRLAIETLRDDPSSRRCYVDAWDPREDYPGVKGRRNVPCPVGFAVHQLAGELHMTATLRSSDFFVGLPYDVMSHAFVLDAMAASLGLRPGTLQMSLSHVHLYEPHWEMARDSLNHGQVMKLGPQLPGWTVKQIEDDPDGYVEHMHQAALSLPLHPFDVRPEVFA